MMPLGSFALQYSCCGLLLCSTYVSGLLLRSSTVVLYFVCVLVCLCVCVCVRAWVCVDVCVDVGVSGCSYEFLCASERDRERERGVRRERERESVRVFECPLDSSGQQTTKLDIALLCASGNFPTRSVNFILSHAYPTRQLAGICYTATCIRNKLEGGAAVQDG